MNLRGGYRKFLADPDASGNVAAVLSHLGGGLLAANAQSLDPGHYGNTLGRTMQGAGPVMQQAQASRDRGKLTSLTIEEAERERAEKEKQRQAYEGLLGGTMGPQAAMMAGGGPTVEAAGLLGSPQPGLLGDLTPTQRGILGALGPDDGAAVLAQQAFPKPGTPTDRMKNATAAGLRPGSPEYNAFVLDQQKSGGPFEGKGMDAQALNILLTGDPGSDAYAAAYAHYGQPKVMIDPTTGQIVSTRPDMSPYRPPGRGNASARPAQGRRPTSTTTSVPGATVTRTDGPSTGKFTETQYASALYADRMTESGAVLDAFDLEGTSFWGNIKNTIPGGNFLQSPEYQQYDQAKRDFINATLRRESGAAIADHEFENANKQYFPQPGDSREVIEQKRRNRKTAIEGISRAAGPSYTPRSPADYDKPLPALPPGFELVE